MNDQTIIIALSIANVLLIFAVFGASVAASVAARKRGMIDIFKALNGTIPDALASFCDMILGMVSSGLLTPKESSYYLDIMRGAGIEIDPKNVPFVPKKHSLYRGKK